MHRFPAVGSDAGPCAGRRVHVTPVQERPVPVARPAGKDLAARSRSTAAPPPRSRAAPRCTTACQFLPVNVRRDGRDDRHHAPRRHRLDDRLHVRYASTVRPAEASFVPTMTTAACGVYRSRISASDGMPCFPWPAARRLAVRRTPCATGRRRGGRSSPGTTRRCRRVPPRASTSAPESAAVRPFPSAFQAVWIGVRDRVPVQHHPRPPSPFAATFRIASA